VNFINSSRTSTIRSQSDCDPLSFFTSHETVLASESKPGMAAWREEIFALMQPNAEETASYLRVPVRRVMQVGAEMKA